MERTGVCVCICMCSVSCEKEGARLVARRWPRKEDIDWSFLPHHASPFAFLSPFFFALPGLSSFSSTHALLGGCFGADCCGRMTLSTGMDVYMLWEGRECER